MEESAFLEKISIRTSRHNAERITAALRDAHLLPKLEFLKDGQSTSVFTINDSGLVLKVFDRRIRKNPRVFDSRYQLQDYYRSIIKDNSTLDDKDQPTEVVVEIEPRLTEKGVTRLHQEMLRYKLWTEEGLEFWDTLPPPSNPREIKNVLIDHRGVPYQIDEDASKAVDEPDFPADANGKRTDAQYRAWRAGNWNEAGRPDAIGEDRFKEITAACKASDWPEDQRSIFDARINFDTLGKFAEAISGVSGARLRKSWVERTSRPDTDTPGRTAQL